MTEKEERIYIDIENDNLDRLKHLSMARQEAINRMAYAMLKTDDPEAAEEWLQLQWNSTRIRKHYMVMAECALNALLGVSND